MLKVDKCPGIRLSNTFLSASLLNDKAKTGKREGWRERKREWTQSIYAIRNKYNSKSQEIKIKWRDYH